MLRQAGLTALLAVLACLAGAAERDPTPPPREFRAAWVASVANIDWPSRPGLGSEQQKAEAIAILDRCRALRLNAVILQVRPQADALYPSELEPWSYFLTGEQGRPPEPSYDPLAFWVGEAHARGLELHAWLNPYRASHPAHRGELSPRSVVRAQPELVVKLGDAGYYWMDPALRAVQDRSHAVVLDLARRYEIDGIHFDDYFYPYPSYNDGRDFPDDASWQAYTRGGGRLSRADWRRRAVDDFVRRVGRSLRKLRPAALFGISPFGIWRPGHPESIAGFDQHEQLYADARRWLREGWVDYLSPQLYWPIARVPQSFPVLLRWWLDENAKRRHLWPGLSLGRATDSTGGLELLNQIMVTRGMARGDPGQLLFSMKRLMEEEPASQLLAGPYQDAALVPRTPWLDRKAPAAPRLQAASQAGRLEASWTARDPRDVFLWVVYELHSGRWSHEIVPAARTSLAREHSETPAEAFAVSAVDRNGNESTPALVRFPPAR